MPKFIIIHCSQLPPRHGQCLQQQLAAQQLSSGGSGLFGTELSGTLRHSWLFPEPAVLAVLALHQTGRTDGQGRAHRGVTPSLACCKPDCSALTSGLQLSLSTLPRLFCSPLPTAEPAVLVKACLSQSQTIRDSCPAPAGGLIQIPEDPAPIHRAAASLAFPSHMARIWGWISSFYLLKKECSSFGWKSAVLANCGDPKLAADRGGDAHHAAWLHKACLGLVSTSRSGDAGGSSPPAPCPGLREMSLTVPRSRHSLR